MKKFLIAAMVAAGLAVAAPGHAVTVLDPTPNGTFSDGEHSGYVSADENGVKACNESDGNDSISGYVWVNPNGESTKPSYGNENVGAGDKDGIDDGNPDNGTENHDCP